MQTHHHKQDMYKWLDGELKDAEKEIFEAHSRTCSSCQKEIESLKTFHDLLKTAPLHIESSDTFEADFWNMVYAREREPWFSKLLKEIESFMPMPNVAQALAVLLVAFLIGGAGGVVSVMPIVTPERLEGARDSVKYLSGFQEFKGIPSPSVAASYLKAIEERNSR